MRSFRLVLVVLVWCLCSVDSCPECVGSNWEYNNEWETYKYDNNKDYDSCSEECNRRLTWEDRCKYIDDFIRSLVGGSSYEIATNKFADWTDEEISYSLHGLVVPPDEAFEEPESTTTPIDASEEPESTIPPGDPSEVSASTSSPPILTMTPPIYINYTELGYVTSVKNQVTCGNCWAHSAAGAIEGQLYKSCGQLVNVSVQQINDCCNDAIYDSHGCSGGWMNGAFLCMNNIGGIVTSDVYSQKNIDQDCLIPDESETRYTCSDFVKIAPYNESSLMEHLLTVGPIACTMDASPMSFTLYKSGVYNDRTCPRQVNHAVLLTGCGTTSDGLDYWIIKNSWGTDWGENGYFRMIRDINRCDIAHYCSYPVNCDAVKVLPPSE